MAELGSEIFFAGIAELNAQVRAKEVDGGGTGARVWQAPGSARPAL